MNNNFSLQTLLDLSHARMEHAARKLGQLLASEQEGTHKLRMLVEYRDEYQQRFLEEARQGLARELWHNYQAFLGRLDQAIAQQRQALQASKQRTHDGQQAWLGERNKARAFDTLSHRHRAGVLRAEGRAQQKLADEHAAKSKGDEDRGNESGAP